MSTPGKMTVDLSGKVALVTGGSRGLGREMVLAFAECGADVMITSRKLDVCDELAAEVRERYGVRVGTHACHVGHWDELPGLVDATIHQLGKISILVNNAGLSPLYPSLGEVTEELYDKVFDVNLKGPFRLSALTAEHMVAGEGGSIINISSVASLRVTWKELPYAAAKGGLNIITEGFANAYGPKVRANTIVAGPFLTDISKAWDMERFDKLAQNFALERGGQPNEIVGAALYLASDASSFTTGAQIVVDGGMAASFF